MAQTYFPCSSMIRPTTGATTSATAVQNRAVFTAQRSGEWLCECMADPAALPPLSKAAPAERRR